MCSAHQSSESAAGDEDSNDRSTAERSPALERTVLVNTKTRTLPTSAPQNKFPIGRIRRLRTFFSLDRDAQYRTWYRPASTARTKQSHVDKADRKYSEERMRLRRHWPRRTHVRSFRRDTAEFRHRHLYVSSLFAQGYSPLMHFFAAARTILQEH